jgi:hypothetical protein
MKTLLSCLIFSVLVSIFAYLCMSNKAENALWVVYVNPIGVVIGFVAAFQGVLESKKYLGLLGLTQLSFWSFYGFFTGLKVIEPPNVFLQIFLITIITIYLCASLTFFGLSFYKLRWGEKKKDDPTT